MPLPKDPIKAQLWRDRQSAAQTGKSRNSGEDNPFYGKHHSQETKQVLSEMFSGANNPNYGATRPQCVKDAISCANRGKTSPFKGKLHSYESRNKMSASRKGNLNRLGKPCSDEQRLKISEKTKERAVRGPDNPRWKGGITPENVMARHSLEYREWRKKVFERDAYTCQRCGDKKGGNLHPHHVKAFSEYPKLRYAVDNGITLCKTCHEAEHNRKL